MLCILILIPEYENCIIVHLGCKDVPYPLDSGVRMRETIALDVCHCIGCVPFRFVPFCGYCESDSEI